jgi:hypothetical protein
MYCRNCGKELPEGSKFCPNCGVRQNGTTTNSSSKYYSLFKKHQKVICIYIAWLLVHLSLFLFSDGRYHHLFYPYNEVFSEVIRGNGSFSLFDKVDAYDISELFFYTILLPFIIWGFVKVHLQLLKNKVIAWIYGILCLLIIGLICYSNNEYTFFIGNYKLYHNWIVLLITITVVPAILVGVLFIIKKLAIYKKHEKTENGSTSKEFSSSLNSVSPKPNDANEKENNHSKDQMLEAEMITMPLFKRLIASIIDHVVILLLLVVMALFCVILSPYEGPGTLGVISAFLDISPKNLPGQFMRLDIYVTIFSIFIFFMYFGLAELRWKASLGKYLLKGILLDSDKIIIKETNAKRTFTRLGLYIGYAVIFHFQMGLGYFPVIILYMVFMSLPILFTKQSLLDLMTGTIYAKRK